MAIASYIRDLMNSKDASVIRKMFEEGSVLKKQFGAENVYDFSIGNPDLEPPAEFLAGISEEALKQCKGSHGYMPNAGYWETRCAMAKKVSEEQGVSVTGDQVVMSVGAAGALNVVFKAILSPGDEVIVPAPFFAEYTHYVHNYGGILKPVKTLSDFSLDVDGIKTAVTGKTVAVLINSPNNPSGVVYNEDTVKKLATADIAQLEEILHPLGFYRAKAKNLKALAAKIDELGFIPDTIDELVKLPGVGRKTANVMMAVAFGRPAMPVDTHVFRVTNRMGLASAKTPLETEKQLVAHIPAEWLSTAHHWFILHGRYVCLARKPKCEECGLSSFCKFLEK